MRQIVLCTATIMKVLSSAAALWAGVGCAGVMSEEVGSVFPSTSSTPTATPNFILLMSDDMGWGDVSYNNVSSRINNPGAGDISYVAASTCSLFVLPRILGF